MWRQGVIAICLLCFLHQGFSSSHPEEAHPLNAFYPDQLRFDASTNSVLTVNATLVETPEGEWVQVSWQNVARPAKGDVIALYTVEEQAWYRKAPIKSTYAMSASSHLSHGAGSIKVKLLNHRQDVRFALIRRFFGVPVLTALSSLIQFKNKNAPLYVHLALSSTSNAMRVQWVSGSSKTSWVQWGTSSGQLKKEAQSTATTYTAEDLCGAPATKEGYIFPGYMHAAVIPKLSPRQTYYYRVGNEEEGFSQEFSFVAPPEVGTKDEIKVIGLADMGQYNIDHLSDPNGRSASLLTSARINAEENVDLITHIGDLSYACGYVADWDVFFDQMLPITSRVPYMTTPGNHERLYPNSGDRYGIGHDSGGECGVVYEKRLQMPIQGPDQPWYSFDFGPMHFTMISTEHPFEPGTAQYSFLEKNLNSVDRQKTPWVVLGCHRPFYPGITRDFPPRGYWYVAQELQRYLENLLNLYKVDMIWSGHHHSYQRTCPVYKKQCVPFDEITGEARAPVQLIFGHAGAHQYTNLVKEPFIEYQENFYGYVRIHANQTQLRVESVRNEDKKVVDTVTLYKGRP